jgi:translation initiation factor IF-2
MGIDDLLETIQIQSEVLELQANPDRNAKAVVIESSLERGRGAVATVIVQNGTLQVGNSIVVGSHHGKVKMLLNDKKEAIKYILPGQTGVVVGLSGVPASGSDLVATDTEKEARELADKIKQYERNKLLSKTTKASFDELGSMIAEGKLNTLKIILKTDVHGTLEAIKTSLESLRNDEVKVSIISEGVGGITENDVVLASDSENIMIVGFNVRPTGAVKTLADKKGVKLKTYSVIYDILNDVTNLLTGMMKPIEEEVNTGQAEIKQLFSTRDGTIAGCMIIDGVVTKGIFARLIRNGVILADTTIHSLKRFKDEVNEVKKGYECGILLKDLNDVKEGDIIETYKKIEKQAKL